MTRMLPAQMEKLRRHHHCYCPGKLDGHGKFQDSKGVNHFWKSGKVWRCMLNLGSSLNLWDPWRHCSVCRNFCKWRQRNQQSHSWCNHNSWKGVLMIEDSKTLNDELGIEGTEFDWDSISPTWIIHRKFRNGSSTVLMISVSSPLHPLSKLPMPKESLWWKLLKVLLEHSFWIG